ncbi:hypothetical protein [Deinococcus hohokamensis]|uniref:Uncharacterized protein n=1 Tax=Deinococcus hohokamensis TaxID=309883 RepID=A0ABV9I625_9DEIO
MLKQQNLTSLIALGTVTHNGVPLGKELVLPWLKKHLASLVSKAQVLRDGATWTEVGALLEVAVLATQELKGVLKGQARAQFVLAVVQALVRKFAPPSAQWIMLLLNSPFALMLIEMAFKRLFPRINIRMTPTEDQVQHVIRLIESLLTPTGTQAEYDEFSHHVNEELKRVTGYAKPFDVIFYSELSHREMALWMLSSPGE